MSFTLLQVFLNEPLFLCNLFCWCWLGGERPNTPAARIHTNWDTHLPLWIHSVTFISSVPSLCVCVCARLFRLLMCWHWWTSFEWFHWIKRHFLSPIMNQRLPGASVSVSSLHTSQPLHSDIKWGSKVSFFLWISEFPYYVLSQVHIISITNSLFDKRPRSKAEMQIFLHFMYIYIYIVILQMLLSKATYKWGQWKQSKSTKEQWYASAITSLR